jgi:hypothetical protein
MKYQVTTNVSRKVSSHNTVTAAHKVAEQVFHCNATTTLQESKRVLRDTGDIHLTSCMDFKSWVLIKAL